MADCITSVLGIPKSKTDPSGSVLVCLLFLRWRFLSRDTSLRSHKHDYIVSSYVKHIKNIIDTYGQILVFPYCLISWLLGLRGEGATTSLVFSMNIRISYRLNLKKVWTSPTLLFANICCSLREKVVVKRKQAKRNRYLFACPEYISLLKKS